MAIWQVTFYLFPTRLVGDSNEMPEKAFDALTQDIGGAMSDLTLPADYADQVAELLPPMIGWCPDMEVWGSEHSDDFAIWREKGKLTEIIARIDVRKLDNNLLTGLLELAERWGCVLVETRYRLVCRMGLPQFRAMLAGHPHCRAMKDPDTWFPVLADEVKRDDERGQPPKN